MNPEILFVDDEPDLLAGIQRSLKKEYAVDTAVGGAAAFEMMRNRSPYAVVVADMRMPEMNGVEFLVEMEKRSPETVRMMLTGNADQETARHAVNEGHIFRFLTKPCPREELSMALRAGLKQHALVTAERDVLEKTLNGSARILSDILAMHDPAAFGKSQRLRDYMKAFAKHLQLKQTWDLELAAMLSQIGCVTIPQALLAKIRQGQVLTPVESDMLRRVPQIGYNLLSNIPRLEPVAKAILYQNKNYDGTGFPIDNVLGEDIPIGARILRVLQDLAALEPSEASKAKALANMLRFPGRYDPRVVESVAAVFDICLEQTPSAESQIKLVRITHLRVGSTFVSEARTRNGSMIVPTGTQVSPMLLEKLRNFAQLGNLEEPMKIIE